MFFNSIREISSNELASLLQNPPSDLRVIDVRQPEEIAQGTVPKAEAVPLHTLPMRVNEFSAKEKLIMVCRSGARSAQACMYLQQQGFKDVINLRGGMIGWVQSGLAPVPLAG